MSRGGKIDGNDEGKEGEKKKRQNACEKKTQGCVVCGWTWGGIMWFLRASGKCLSGL